MEYQMTNKILDLTQSQLYAKPHPLKEKEIFFQKNKTVKIQKIDDNAYYTKQLFHAVQHGNIQWLKTVPIKLWQDRMNILDEKNNYSLLHYACLENHKEIVAFLLMFKPDINIVGAKQMRPLHLATQKGHVEIVELLCSQRSTNIDASDSKGQTPLHTACRRGHHEVVKVLLSYKASVNKVELDKISVLHHPVRRNDIKMVETLITYGAPMNLRNNNGVTPIMIAAIEGHLEMFKNLLNEMENLGMKIKEVLNEKDNDGFSCLTHAANNKNDQIIKICLENNADIYSKQADGKTILHTAAIMGYSKLFELLDNKLHNFDTVDNGLNTPLHQAIMNNNLEMVKILLSKNANVNICNRHFQTPIMVACAEVAHSINNSEIIQILHEANADLKIKDFEMKTVFHYLVAKENMEMIKYFAKKLPPNVLGELINSQDDSYNSPLHCAAKIGNEEICTHLLQMGANPILFADNDALPLHVATINGHLGCVKVLLEACQETSYYRNADENSAINLAAEYGRYEIFKYLKEIGKDHTSKDEFGRNTLMFAAKSGCIPIIDIILNDEVNVNVHDQMKTTSLHLASENGHLEVVKRLWEHGAKISENIFGQTQVDIAVLNQQWKVVRFFLNQNNWKQVMKFRHQNGQSHIKILIRKSEEITLELLDKCITEPISNKMDPNYEVKFWFGLLDSGPDDTASLGRRYIALKTMADCGRLNLLRHPVSSKLLLFKWKKFGLGYYLFDFFMYLVFIACITSYMTIYLPPKDTVTYYSGSGCESTNASMEVQKSSSSNQVFFMGILVYCIASMQLLLQLGRLFSQKLRFFRDSWNYVFISCHVLVFIFIKDPSKRPCVFEWQLGPALIFLTWFLLLYYLQYWPIVGVKVMMFQRVLISIVKVLLIFLCLFVGFGFGFFIINSKEDPFQNQWLAMIKSFGMMIGEIDLVTYFLTGKTNYATISYIIIVIFIIIMPITLFNLMIGLAVGDIESIMSEASLETIKLLVNFVWEVESIFPRRMQRQFYVTESVENYKNIARYNLLKYIFKDLTDSGEFKSRFALSRNNHEEILAIN